MCVCVCVFVIGQYVFVCMCYTYIYARLYIYIYIYIYIYATPPQGSTILAVSENWIHHLAVSEDSEANEAYMKRVVNECDAC